MSIKSTYDVDPKVYARLVKIYPKCNIKFCQHKNGAKERGIEFLFNLATWIEMWKGKYSKRGRKGYVMSRRNDIGPYSTENCFIQTAVENVKEAHINKPKGLVNQRDVRSTLRFLNKQALHFQSIVNN